MQGHTSGVEYDERRGEVKYLDSKGLSRPLFLPKQQFIIVGVFVVIAIIIGAVLIHNFYSSTYGSAQSTQETVDENLSREVTYDLPVLTDIIGLDDDAIRTAFEEAGLSIYEENDEEADEEAEGSEETESEDSSDDGMELVKFPSDMDASEAQSLYEEGISSLGAEDASMLLNGMWTLSVDRSSGANMIVRYADFSSGGLEAAVNAAIATEGFDTESASEIDEDDSGNTYREGSLEIDGTAYTWRVSAIALDEIYDISGLPDDAVYVGIRLSVS